jgi:predicted ATPase
VKLEPVPGRILKVPRACNQVCIYYFHELMENVMGDSDFRAICKNFKAIIIKNMRQIKRQERNTANRLIKLFDEAYYRNAKIYIEGTVGLDELIMPIPEK